MSQHFNKKLILGYTATIAIVLGYLFYANQDIQVAPLRLDDKITVSFPYTDENNGESLIIKTNQQTYSGLADSDAYISITNTTNVDEKAVLLFYFPKADAKNKNEINPGIKNLAQYQESDKTWNFVKFFKDNIKLNDNLLSHALKKRESIPKELAINSGTQIEIPANKTIYFKSKIQYPPGSKGEFWIETIGANGGYGLLDPWYTSTFSYRKKITIPYTKVSGGSNLANFPVLISHTDLDLRTTANGGKAASGSGEFIITSSDGTTSLPYEIESYSATTGQFIGWVNVTTLSATADTYLYMYYGGPSSGATNQNKTGTWTSYVNVYHFGSEATLNLLDSSSNGNNLTNHGAAAGAGKFSGGAVVGDSGDDMVTGNYAVGTTTITAEAWVRATTFVQNGQVWGRNVTEGIPNEGWQGFFNSADSLFYWWGDAENGFTTSLTPLIVGGWNHVVATITGTTGKVYFNGTLVNTGVTGVASNMNKTLTLGEYTDAQYNFSGTMDEVRVSSVVRSAGWIATEYANQNSPRTFYTIGGQEVSLRTPAGVNFGTSVSSDTKPGWYQSGATPWGYRKKITIPYTKVSGGSNLANFPVLISHTDLDLRTTANGGKAASGSGEFIITSSDGTTSLPYEIESYSATTGQFIGWVNVTTLSATADTYLYMYYGGAAAGGATNQNKTGTWNTDYVGVYHLGDGSTLSATDSSSSANNGTISGATAAGGKVGSGAASFDGNDRIALTTTGYTTSADWTIEAWTKSSTVDSNYYILLNYGNTPTNGTAPLLTINSSNQWEIQTWGCAANCQAGDAVLTNSWVHLVGIGASTSQITLYKDGKANAGPKSVTNSPVISYSAIGSSAEAVPIAHYKGVIDEVRISKNNRSAGWIATEYANQNSPRTFYVLGGQEGRTSFQSNLKYGTSTSADTKPGWKDVFSYRKKITIPYTKVSGGSNLTNFPVLISHTDLDLRTTANGGKAASGSGEFIFTSSDGTTSLPYEIETYSATTGQFIGWVNVTTLSATADTYLYMYYGGAAAGGATNQNKTGTWNSGYKAVWHVKDGTTLNLTDSTSNAHNGTNSSSTAVTGKINGAVNFNGTSQTWTAGSNVTDFKFANTDSYTISAWFNPSIVDSTWNSQINYSRDSPQWWGFWQSDTNKWVLVGSSAGSPSNLVGSTTLQVNSWFYVVGVQVGGSGRILYVNGASEAQDANDLDANGTGTLAVGAYIAGSEYYGGIADELRVSNTNRPAGWIATEYANQSAPRTFYVLGGQEGRTSANPGLQFK